MAMSESTLFALDRDAAATYAKWFRCLGDTTRLLLLNQLALLREALTVGEIVELSDVGQSTVSHHLKVLTETGFVLLERRGTSSRYRVNSDCLNLFPAAAEVVMGLRRAHTEPEPPSVSSDAESSPEHP
jgi:DNA-binding transcriptional ArsR family regulator